MGGSGVIDNFLGVFTSYIDSGFGLLGGEVAFIATTLIVIDVTLAALFWSWGADDDIIARLVKKTLFVGAFAYIIDNWNNLARIIFESFAGLGLKGSGTGFSTADLLRPGRVAQVGLDAARPLLESISDLMGWVAFFENFIQIACLLFAWALVLLAFFILAIQLFVTLIEFKLTVLAGFVLIPFGLFGKGCSAVSSLPASRCWCSLSSSASARRCSASSPPASAGSRRRSTTRWRSCSQHFPCSASASSDRALPTVWFPEARNLVLVLPLAPASPSEVLHLPQAVRLAWPCAVGLRHCPAALLPFVVAQRRQVPPRPPTISDRWGRPALPVWRPVSAVSREEQAPPPSRL